MRSALGEKAGYLLAKTCRAHRGVIGGLLSGLGLHVGQEMVLIELWAEDRLRGSDLAGRLGVEPPTITRMLRRMENCGLLYREPDPDDARSFRVRLTAKGRALEEPVIRAWEAAEEHTLAGLSPGERQTFRGLLGRVRENLETCEKVSADESVINKKDV